jgi:uncharacterized protein (TIGR03437 family)
VGGGAKSDSIVLIGRAGYYNGTEVFRSWLVLAVLCAGTARGTGPSYSAAGIVNASNYGSGPFAPNSVVSIFGSGLARSSHALAASDISGGMLPLEMNYVSVYVQNQAVPLLFASHGQINFLISSVQVPGPVKLRVVAEGISGPEIDLTLVLSAPALLADAGGYAIATTADGKLFTADAPAHAGDTIVVYCTGLQDGAESPACGDSKPRGPDSGNARA